MIGTIDFPLVPVVVGDGHVVTAESGGIRAPAAVFDQIFTVFLILGTLVGIVVISYMVYNAYKYRGDHGETIPEEERPKLGELPSGGGGGKKLFLSFSISAVIVISLIVWTYGTLLYVEQGPAEKDAGEHLEIKVEGYQFGWTFIYPNGHKSQTLRVPKGRVVELTVTSRDVFHTFGIPELRTKADAIPGQYTDTWFIAKETRNYTAQCYELCGAGHSYMEADVVVMEPEAYQEWYESTGNETESSTNTTTTTTHGSVANPVATGVVS